VKWLETYIADTRLGKLTVESVPITFVDYEEAFWHYDWATVQGYDFKNTPVKDVDLEAEFDIVKLESKINLELDKKTKKFNDIKISLYLQENGISFMYVGGLNINSNDVEEGKYIFENQTLSDYTDAEKLYKKKYGQEISIYEEGKTETIILERVGL